ncbi:hypothetical protein ACHAWT_006385 [Skeletonema menzelii]
MYRLTYLSILLLMIPAAISFQSSSTQPSVHITNSKCSSAILPSITPTSTSLQSTLDEATTETTSKNKKKKTWFPIRPADALSPSNDYNSLVKSAYLRHILLETEEMADLVMNLYLNGGKSEDIDNTQSSYEKTGGDVFSRLAVDVSTCPFTREDSGEIGWVDNPSNNREKAELNDVYADILSSKAIEELFSRRVKGGDVIKVEGKEGWHLIRVDDLYIQLVDETNATGSKNKINKDRPKLKGSGKIPLSPIFQKIGAETSNDGIDNDEAQAKMIYSVPNAKHYQILTSGCQMNVADSERIMGVLEGELGLTALESINAADPTLIASSDNKKSKNKKKPTPDILLLNTCTIRDHAEQKVYDALGPYAAMKREGKPLAIVVAGCVAQQEGEALLRRFPEIDLVLGPQYIPWLGDLLVEVGKGSQLCMTESMIWSEKGGSLATHKDSSREKDGDWMTPIKRGHSVRAWVNVIYGCNEHCTYCVVPSVRGVEQSRSMEAILQECLQLAASGYKEVTLLGQNIDAYGRDMIPKRTFADLLHYLNDNLPPNTISRIRYVTSHPRYFSERVIDAVANLDKVCECFHMPFQAGDDKVLKDMRRGYTFDSYMKIIQKIKAKAPDASICGDVIVGFPGETEEQFQRTLDLMEEVKFDNLNTFAYSPRPNTEAANWENQISPEVQSERLQRVQALAAKHALERSERYLGKVIEVLVEDRNPKNGGEVMGRTRQGRQVFFAGDIDELKGQLVNVEITEARTWSLVGSIVD